MTKNIPFNKTLSLVFKFEILFSKASENARQCTCFEGSVTFKQDLNIE